MVVVLALCWYVYQPGLGGGFLFDDWVNLDALGAFGPVDNATTLWRYLTSGNADATGRPLALASFLLDARDWPAEPYLFKRTGLILHLVNGLLLVWLLRGLGRALAPYGDASAARASAYVRADIAAVLGAGLWLLHPLLVSTTLYVVQREAMLPGTFILLGLIGYVAGRKRAAIGQQRGVWMAAASIVGGTALASLCKANGALLPLLAWLLDAILLAPRQAMEHSRVAKVFRWTRRCVLVFPGLLLLAALLVVGVRGFVDEIAMARPWTTGERLLTQARVVVDYLHLLWSPRPYSHGLFNDGIAVSHGVLSPPSTLACLLLLAVLAGGAFASWRRLPILSASILFFLAAHLMESSVVPLELYFEHRNYVPALLMFWPLGWWLAGAWGSQPHQGLTWVRKTLCFVLPMLLAALTFLRADLWGNVADQALLWVQRNPDSPRAQAYAAQTEARRGHAVQAIARMETALAKYPHEVQLAANLIDARCMTGGVAEEDVRTMSAALTSNRVGNLAFGWLSGKLDGLSAGKPPCRGLELPTLERLVEALAKNPGMASAPGRVAEIHHLRGRLQLLSGDANLAFASFNAALHVLPAPAKALRQAAMLGDAGYPELGLRHLEMCSPTCGELPDWSAGMPAIHARLLDSQGYWKAEIAHLRRTLAEIHADQG